MVQATATASFEFGMPYAPHISNTPRQRARRSRRHERRNATRVAKLRAYAAAGQQLALIADPLTRPRRGFLTRTVLVGLVMVASFVAHAVLLVAFSSIGATVRGRQVSAARPEPIRVSVHHVEKPAPAPEPVAKNPTQRGLRPARARNAPEVPKMDVPALEAAEPAPPPSPSAPPPRRIVGLSLESTVVGGNGPSFAVGNTRMGSTAGEAADPEVASVTPRGSSNRKATRIPTGAGRAFTAPKKIATVDPDYPALLRSQGIEDDVVLRVDIGADGRVVDVAVVKASRHAALNEAAVSAAKAERYVPAKLNGQPVADTVKFTVRFRLNDI
jgi:TonB family protein